MVLFGQRRRWQVLSKIQKLGLAVLAAGALTTGAALAKESTPASNDVATVRLSDLPPQAQTVERLIHAGGPFPNAKDGSVFGNRERILPARPRGEYREYTVRTPGARDRGARRIVCGGRQATAPDTCYYTDDHYASFRRIVP